MRPRPQSKNRECHGDGARPAIRLDDQQITNNWLSTYQKARSRQYEFYLHHLIKYELNETP